MFFMVGSWFRKHIFNNKAIKDNASIQHLQRSYRHRGIWTINTSTLSKGVAIGIFVAFLPMPGQMIIAAMLAILFYANLPIAVAMTWITNPFTFIPINYLIYWIGKTILAEPFSGDFSTKQIAGWGKAYFIGLAIVAISGACLGYFVTWVICYFSKRIKCREK